LAEINKGILRSSTATAAATLLSRLLGLVRTILEAAFIGGGAVMTSWDIAFMVPNLFRRLLGEGALGSALVPLISHTLEKGGRDTAKRDLTCVLAVLSGALALLCIVIAGASMLIAPLCSRDYVRMAFEIIPLVIPYAFFICLVGALTSVLNSLRVFFLPALGALFLNIFMIAALMIFGSLYSGTDKLLPFLSGAVLISGLFQLLLTFFLLWRIDMLPLFSISAFKNMKVITELWRLTLPGIVGASALQISLLVDKGLACWLGPHAEPALKYSDRIIYLPIGVFAVSFGAVALANMSRSAAKNNIDEMLSSMIFSMRHLLFICAPIAVFVFAFREPIIKVLFMRGLFGEQALKETSWAMLFYSFGIPAFAALKITVSGFYARKDMKTPLKISLVCIAVNIILNLILMWPLQQGGIALATVISSYLNNILLLFFLRKSLMRVPLARISATLATCVPVSIASVFAALFVYSKTTDLFKIPKLPADFCPLLFAGITFLGLYFIVCFILKSREIPEIFKMFRKRA
jgi:putative peptidoglycan lipid II flippase